MAVFGPRHTNQALDLLELVELAWHDCYGESSPSEEVIDQVLLVSRGTLGGLIEAGRLAVIDRRDLQVAADDLAGGA